MTWFFAVLVVAIMGVTAVVAAGRGGTMAEVYDDRPDARVPADGPLTARDLEEVRFTTALRGYRMSEVDALLDRLTGELRERELTDRELRDRGPGAERSTAADRDATAPDAAGGPTRD